MKAIIVDDELNARESLSTQLAIYCKHVSVVDLCDSVDSAIDAIKEHNPSLVFLDIDMPVKDGFELLKSFKDIKFNVIFTTAYNQFAIKAIKTSALDYLLKPIDIDELVAAVEKASKRDNQKILQDQIEHLSSYLQKPEDKISRIILPSQNGYSVELIEDIIRCESDGNCTEFYFVNGKRYRVNKVLKEYEELLSDKGFFRVHQSHLVNLMCIKRYTKGDSPNITMSDGAVVYIARNKKADFLTVFFEKMIV